MKNNIINPIFLFCALFFIFTPVAFAADFSFGVGEQQQDGTRDVALMLKADNPINALEGVIHIGGDVAVLGISDAKSMVQFWIKKPSMKAGENIVGYSGIIPGGFTGEGPVLYLSVKGDPKGLSIDKDLSQTLLNDGMGTKETVRILPPQPLLEEFMLHVSTDKTPPQNFIPQIAMLPTESGDRLAVIFNTHDDQSGMAHYEIVYSSQALDPNDPTLLWKVTDSPSRIPDGVNAQFIYVKAIDRAGNARIAMLSNGNTQQRNFGALLALIFGIIALVVATIVLGSRKYYARTGHIAKS